MSLDRSENRFADWIGRVEECRDVVSVERLRRFSATFDEDPALPDYGDTAPPLSHWTLFLPTARQSELGEDGHAKRGGFLPPVNHLPRRMWAGGRIDFFSPLRVGMSVVRRSEIVSVKERDGSLGPLIFVTVRHEIREEGGSEPLLVEDHDIVYRGAEALAAKRLTPAETKADWESSIVPDETLLFRYSALTFNGHRIHYDRRYATTIEGYPGLIVHGPLIATLLVNFLRANSSNSVLKAFSFRAVSPVFDGARMFVRGTVPDAEGRARLWAANAENGLAMQAEAQLA